MTHHPLFSLLHSLESNEVPTIKKDKSKSFLNNSSHDEFQINLPRMPSNNDNILNENSNTMRIGNRNEFRNDLKQPLESNDVSKNENNYELIISERNSLNSKNGSGSDEISINYDDDNQILNTIKSILIVPDKVVQSSATLSSYLVPSPFLSHLQTLNHSHEVIQQQIQKKNRNEMIYKLEKELMHWVEEKNWSQVVEYLAMVKDEWIDEDRTDFSNQNANIVDSKYNADNLDNIDDGKRLSIAKQRNHVLSLLNEEFTRTLQYESNDFTTVVKFTTYIGKLGGPLPNQFIEFCASHLKQDILAELKEKESFPDKIHIIMDFLAGEIENNEKLLLDYFPFLDYINFLSRIQEIGDKICENVIAELINVRSYNKKAKEFENRKLPSKMRPGHYRSNSSSFGNSQELAQNSVPSTETISSLDTILEEITVICSKVETYARFLSNKISNARQYFAKKEADTSSKLSCDTRMTMIKEELALNYLQFESFFLDLSASKAIALKQENTKKLQLHSYFTSNENLDSGSDYSSSEDEEEVDTKNSTFVNDLFFIIRKSVFRSFNTYSPGTVCKLLNVVQTLLQETARSEMAKSLSECTAPRLGESVQYTTEQLERISLSLNDMRTASGYMQKLQQEILQTSSIVFSAKEQENIKHFANQFTTLALEYKDKVEKNLLTMVNGSFEFPLNEALNCFRNANYNIHESELSVYDVNDPFVDTFTGLLDQWMEPFESCLILSNYECFVMYIVSITVKLLMNIIVEEMKAFSQFGGIQLDKDIRNLIRYFGEKSGTSVREKFSELNVISFILKVSSLGEMLEFWNDSAMQSLWKLKDPDRVRRILLLRKDLDQNQVQTLHL